MDDEYRDSSKITYHKRKRWTQTEDDLLVSLVSMYGISEWSTIAKGIENRNSQQCRERWINHVDPAIDKTPFRDDEWKIVIHAQKSKGNSWSEISELLVGRTAVHIKNEWHRRKRKDYNDRGKEKMAKQKLRDRLTEERNSFYMSPERAVNPSPTTNTKVLRSQMVQMPKFFGNTGEVSVDQKVYPKQFYTGQITPDIIYNSCQTLPEHIKTETTLKKPTQVKNPMNLENILVTEINEKSKSLEDSIRELKKYMGISDPAKDQQKRRTSCDIPNKIPPVREDNEFLYTPPTTKRAREEEQPSPASIKKRRIETNEETQTDKFLNLLSIANSLFTNGDDHSSQ